MPPERASSAESKYADADRRRGVALSRFLGVAEDIVYALIAVLLGVSALYALVYAVITLGGSILARETGIQPVLTVLDQVLVVLILVEIFYTIRLSIRQHQLAVEPFVAVALIAVVRRILVVTAEEHRLLEADPDSFWRLLLELSVLAGLILVLVVAMGVLRRLPRGEHDRERTEDGSGT